MRKMKFLFFAVLCFVMAATSVAFGETVVLDACENADQFDRSYVDYYNYYEGNACVGSIPCVNPKMTITLSNLDVKGLTEDAYLEFYVYGILQSHIEDALIRLGTEDSYYQFTLSDMKKGWNYVSLQLSSAEKVNQPSMSAIECFTIIPKYDKFADAARYPNQSAVKLDYIILTDTPNALDYTETTLPNEVGELDTVYDYYTTPVFGTKTETKQVWVTKSVLHPVAIVGMVVGVMVICGVIALIIVKKKKNAV